MAVAERVGLKIMIWTSIFVKMQVNRKGRNMLLWLIRFAEKEGLLFVRFQRSLELVVGLKIQSEDLPSILQGDCVTKHISVWGINHLALCNKSFGKRRVAIQPFSKELRKNFCA
jgi:hypothetical protein